MRIFIAILGSVIFASCESNTYSEVGVVAAAPTYTANVQPIMAADCTSCHSTDGGQEPFLETYDEVKSAVESNNLLGEIAAPAGLGMPESQRLPQSKIDAVTNWAANGFPN